MEMKYLETFIKVCELGSYTAAAEAMKISQPGVTKQIQRLQATLGVTLLRREEQGFKLTEAGRQVYLEGKNMLAIWNKLSDDCRMAGDHLSGLLRIGASTIPAKHLLPGILAAFHSAYPHVELSVQVADSKQALDSLYRGSIDLAYAGTMPDHPEAHCIPLASDKLVIIANRPGWTEGELSDHPFILREPGSGTRIAFERAMPGMGLNPDRVKCAAEVGDTGLLIQLVEAGMGLAVVSSLEAASLIKEGRVSVVRELPSERHFYLAYMRNSPSQPLIEAFIQSAQAPI